MTSPSAARFRLLAPLALCQIIGWGTTFDMPGALGRIIAADLGFSNEAAFAGLSVMMIVSGLAGPWAGRLLKARGARFCLITGACTMSAGLTIIAAAQGLFLYGLGWLVVGLGAALGLSASAHTAVVEREGLRAKASISLMMIVTGLSAALFWPLLSLVNASFGWRIAVLMGAALQIGLCVPLYLLALPDAPPQPPQETQSPTSAPAETAKAGRNTFLLLAAVSTLFTLVTFGLSPILIALLTASGAAPALALSLASFRSALGVTARLGDILLGRLSTPPRAMAGACLLLLLAFAALAFGAPSLAALILFIGLYGFGSGVGTVARTVLPLSHFSASDFGLMSSRIALPQNIATAFAPVAMTALLDRAGPMAALSAAALLTLAALACLWGLQRGRRS
ncbi:putative MFS family arabinose efflux permease [Rhizobium sp. SG_E_25_P2]|uniref:MFS transporter n=2 Tax=unclassified Rhizobium TaxID=2613769 RepID=UPI00247485FC|nr:MFS transporter [Rhizobium sp. SG_E_25_P2]MDH6268372.1 putative MFS family arabinose efflux permease [Rhizobium sp. SG_E_25_P2]